QACQTDLDTAIAGMAFDQQLQDLTHQCGPRLRWGECGLEGVFERTPARLRPGIQGLARDTDLPTQVCDQAVVPLMCEHLADPLRPLLGRARMRTNHRFLPGAVVDMAHLPYAPGRFCATVRARVSS